MHRSAQARRKKAKATTKCIPPGRYVQICFSWGSVILRTVSCGQTDLWHPCRTRSCHEKQTTGPPLREPSRVETNRGGASAASFPVASGTRHGCCWAGRRVGGPPQRLSCRRSGSGGERFASCCCCCWCHRRRLFMLPKPKSKPDNTRPATQESALSVGNRGHASLD